MPVPRIAPPNGPLNQFKVPALAVAARVTVPASHLLPAVVVSTLGVVYTVAITDVLGEIQVPFTAAI